MERDSIDLIQERDGGVLNGKIVVPTSVQREHLDRRIKDGFREVSLRLGDKRGKKRLKKIRGSLETVAENLYNSTRGLWSDPVVDALANRESTRFHKIIELVEAAIEEEEERGR